MHEKNIDRLNGAVCQEWQGMEDGEMLDWLFENGYAIVPDKGAAGFASEQFDGREDLERYIIAQDAK